MGKTATLANIGSVADSSLGFRNRIINGAMVIDQRNAGASVTPTDGQYTVDRWQAFASAASKYSVQQNAGSVTPPVGFKNYLGITSLSSYSVGASESFRIDHKIEGFNCVDLAWGTADAQAVTISFWVRSSLTGTFGGFVTNAAANRFQSFSYVINSANTWEKKTVTIAGDTTGTWVTDSTNAGVRIGFSVGSGSSVSGSTGSWGASTNLSATGAISVVGTNGATWYITGVQLEKGSTATAFDYRPYGTELALCQRYYQTFVEMIGQASGTTTMQLGIALQNEMRSTPSISATGACSFQDGVTAFTQSSFSYLNQGGSSKGINGYLGNFTGLTQFRMYQRNPTFGILTASAEL